MTLTAGSTTSVRGALRPAWVWVLAAVFAVAMLPTPARAAPITWGAATNISADSDVSTDGTLVYAYNFGTIATSPVINGVTFTAFDLPIVTVPGTPVTFGDVSISESLGDLLGALQFGGYDGVGNPTGAFSGLTSAYQALLGTGALGGFIATLTLELGDLNIGQTYDFQWWSNDSSGNAYAVSTVAEGATGETPVTLSAGSGAKGALGQYVIGRFTADAQIQNITFDSLNIDSFPMINGFQLREGPFSVPAPSAALLALGGFCLILLWRRQRPA
ncbi:MAG: hypothetical protein ACKOBM_18555 [Gammaproteobacteria bacterium]